MNEQRILHGEINPTDLARALIGEFNHGALRAQQIGSGNAIIVQIATHEIAASGGRTGLAVSLRSVADGVAVEVGKQSWLGVAASLGQSAFYALRSPWNLLGRLDDIAQDIENIQLTEDVWRVLNETARSLGAGLELSERLRRVVCQYCLTANSVGEFSLHRLRSAAWSGSTSHMPQLWICLKKKRSILSKLRPSHIK